MMEPAEAYTYSKLCRTLNKTSELPTFPVPSYQISPIRDIINLARELDSLTTKKKRLTHEQSWRDRAEKEMDLIIDDDDVYPLLNCIYTYKYIYIYIYIYLYILLL
ncbi:hypothetical protein KGM_212982 [Danaus plexippus plexippus]|uniref:Uncharacterized protein n=1 Tax=Danaus plexippus plexippus TaxID=278856 RepID=A0A212FG72_DANPL|nr:hypothetical protein KGM_212982 [Danaus plexippus plexippus]